MIELLVVTAIISILVSLALPALGRARAAARKLQCMNHVRNLALALQQFDATHRRLPASGNYRDAPVAQSGPYHTWAVSILPYVDQNVIFQQWDFDRPITGVVNQKLAQSLVPVFVCPDDISAVGMADLSYVVNGGFGFTYRAGSVGDCVLSPWGHNLDLNGDGKTCVGAPSDDEDRALFKKSGVFFLENWKDGGTVRHHTLADILDGTSQTFLVSENVRAGYDPEDPHSGFANPNPYRCAFYIGLPCQGGSCVEGNVDYSSANSGRARINAGRTSAEGSSPAPSSFHEGGVHMAFADGHVKFLAEDIDGKIYAAMASPQGMLYQGTPLEQVIVSGDAY
ncbi:MAG: DUF1559 domain-containing protein [Planctomyces sp.]|nr:DUF1559 domain-containing protein [Planctomyces sp.]